MIPLYDLISIKFPETVAGINVILADYNNGEGPFIQYWGIPNQEMPSKEELDSWQNDDDIKKLYQFKINKQLNKVIYEQLNDLDLRSIRALRTNDIDRINQYEQEAAALRKQLLPIT